MTKVEQRMALLKYATPPPALTLGISALQDRCVISVETRTQAPDRKEDIFAESLRMASVRKDQDDECLSLELAAEVARQQGGGMEVEWRPVMGDAKGSSQTPSYRLEYRLLLP